jgi:hypothetical protein
MRWIYLLFTVMIAVTGIEYLWLMRYVVTKHWRACFAAIIAISLAYVMVGLWAVVTNNIGTRVRIGMGMGFATYLVVWMTPPTLHIWDILETRKTIRQAVRREEPEL